MKNLKVSAVITAAGKGERAGFNKNKLLAPLFGAPALWHTLKKFDIPEVEQVVVACSEEDFAEISAMCLKLGYKAVLGGKTRTESVKRALNEVTGDIVLIHDGARPFLSRELILRCIDSVKRFGTGIAVTPVTDTVAVSHFGLITSYGDRNSACTVQTPQGFLTEEIKRAYELAGKGEFTDDSSLYCTYYGLPHIVEGERDNIKLTFKEDFERERPLFGAGGERVGFGVDVHSFTEGKFLTLAGVKIECGLSLKAHSDGDVIYHALCDALFSAAGLKDIGHYFPDGNERFRGVDSSLLVKNTLKEVEKAGYAPQNISISVQAETPRLAPHIDNMKENISKLTGVLPQDIGLAAGTCEGLGFVGERLGIAAYAFVSLKKVR